MHSDFERARAIWNQKRQQDLEHAARVALQSPMGEDDPEVVNIRNLVDGIDKGIASWNLTKCFGGGVDANGNSVGDFVKSNYLCRKWTAKTGASVARAGQKPDDLPMELEDKNN